MAAKRMQEDEEEQEKHKRPRGIGSSLSSDWREKSILNSVPNNIATAIEPLLRRVVKEEVERAIESITVLPLQRISSIRLRELTELSPSLRLSFQGKLALPIYTNKNIEAEGNSSLEISVIDSQTGNRVHHGFPTSLRVEILVLNGDFPPPGRENWTSEEFNSNLVRQRDGKRPLLDGDLNIIVRDGVGLIRDLSLTDNSSWIRSRRFRLGARVMGGNNGVSAIGEALSEAFIVKDHRGESYKKHHPPSLNDEVWRLEKIGKDGAFHERLSAEGIHTVQDFLRMWVKSSTNLRTILGVGMSDKVWKITTEHARKCNLGSKLYFHHGIDQQCVVILDAVCKPVTVIYNGYQVSMDELSTFQKAEVATLVEDAYNNWGKLKEVEGGSPYNNSLPSTSDVDRALDAEPLNNPTISSYQQTGYQFEVPVPPEVGASSYSASRQEIQLQNAVGSASYIPIPVCESHSENDWLVEPQDSVALGNDDHHRHNFYDCYEPFTDDEDSDKNYGS